MVRFLGFLLIAQSAYADLPEFFVDVNVEIMSGVYEGGWIPVKPLFIELDGAGLKVILPEMGKRVVATEEYRATRVRWVENRQFEFPIQTPEEAKKVLEFLDQSEGTLSLVAGPNGNPKDASIVIGSVSWANTRNGLEHRDVKRFVHLTSPFTERKVYSMVKDGNTVFEVVATHPASRTFKFTLAGKTSPLPIDENLWKIRKALKLDRMGKIRRRYGYSVGIDKAAAKPLLEEMKQIELYYLDVVAALRRRGKIQSETSALLLVNSLGHGNLEDTAKKIIEATLGKSPEVLDEAITAELGKPENWWIKPQKPQAEGTLGQQAPEHGSDGLAAN
ncbi:hypothetical protein K2X33_05305 [bacterium]|nr:hypothetical protein [bacterium]